MNVETTRLLLSILAKEIKINYYTNRPTDMKPFIYSNLQALFFSLAPPIIQNISFIEYICYIHCVYAILFINYQIIPMFINNKCL